MTIDIEKIREEAESAATAYDVPLLNMHVQNLCAEVERLRDAAEVLRGSLAEQAKDYVDVRSKVGVLLGEIADTAVAAGMMAPDMRDAIDGPNAIQFLQQMRERMVRSARFSAWLAAMPAEWREFINAP